MLLDFHTCTYQTLHPFGRDMQLQTGDQQFFRTRIETYQCSHSRNPQRKRIKWFMFFLTIERLIHSGSYSA